MEAHAEDLLERWGEMLLAERGLALLTWQAYRRDLEDWRRYLAERSITDLADGRITGTWVESFVGMLRERGLTDRTMARKRSALRQFYDFIVSESWMEVHPMAHMDPMRAPQFLPQSLDAGMIQALIEMVREQAEGGAFLWVRRRCWVELLYASGMRVHELVGLPWSVPWEGNGALRDAWLIRGKGGRERMVFLYPKALEALDHYRLHPEGPKSGPWVFPGRYADRPITRQRVFQELQACAEAMGWDRCFLSPHRLRHGFASDLLMQGADLRLIQLLLGHATIATTEHYLHVRDHALQQTIHAHHPWGRGVGRSPDV